MCGFVAHLKVTPRLRREVCAENGSGVQARHCAASAMTFDMRIIQPRPNVEKFFMSV